MKCSVKENLHALKNAYKPKSNETLFLFATNQTSLILTFCDSRLLTLPHQTVKV